MHLLLRCLEGGVRLMVEKAVRLVTQKVVRLMAGVESPPEVPR